MESIDKMVVVQLTGGLGNQLFQYAFAYYISSRHNLELVLDTSSFESDALREYSLCAFDIDNRHLKLNSFRWLNQKKIVKIAKFLQLVKFFNFRPFRIVTEQEYGFKTRLLELDKLSNIYLKGYWQSEKYFRDISDIISYKFQITTQPSFENQQIMTQIHKQQSVSLHIRRGDYVNNIQVNAIHGVCSLTYYERAVEHIENNIDSPHFFVFSDDIQWAKLNLRINHPTIYVGVNNSDNAHEDLRLIQNCKHNIIANSTFSWWGAWLNQNPNKIVIAPMNWFVTNDRNTKDLIPNDWHLL